MRNQLSYLFALIFCTASLMLNAQNWNEIIKTTASDASAPDQFGYSVAIDGNYAVIGAWQNDDNGSNSGSAYIFMRSGNTWSQQSKLTASDPSTYDKFGLSVDLDGDYAIVGSTGNDNTGSAYIFVQSGNHWTEQTKITASDADSYDEFGISAAIDGNHLVIGAYGNDDDGLNSGSAYFFIPAILPDIETLTDVTEQCEATPTPPTANNGTITATSNTTFPITTQGTTIITWTYDDGNGNTETQTQNVIVDDTTAPNLSFASPSDATINSCATDVVVPSLVVSDDCTSNDFALDFDGIDDVVTVGQTIGSFKTLEFWMYTENGINGSEEFDYLFSFNDSNLKYIGTGNFTSNYTNETLSIVTNFGEIMTTFANIPPGWNHIAFTGNGTSFNQIIINGESKPVVNNGFPQVFETTTTYLGQFPSSPNSRFNGKLDEVRFWNIVRTEQDIANDYEKMIDPTTTNLLAYYDFEDGTGSSILSDKTGNGAYGILNNMDVNTDWVTSTSPVASVTLTNDFNGTSDASGTYPEGETTVTWTATDANGNTNTIQQTVSAGDTEAPSITFSNSNDANITSCDTNVTIPSPLVSDNCSENIALDFDGINDYIDLGSPLLSPSNGSQSHTIEMWVKATPNNSITILLSQYGWNQLYEYRSNLYIDTAANGGNLVFFKGSYVNIEGTSNLLDNQWHHVAMVRGNSGTLSLYVDGVVEAVGVDTYPYSNTNSLLGGQTLLSDSYYSGVIDEVRIWNTARTQTQIANSINANISNSESGLVAYYKFENGTGSSVLSDVSSNSNHGALINMDPNTDWVTSTSPVASVTLTNDFNGTSDASGTYPEGETMVTWTATDANGNTNTIQQTVSAGDTEAPSITFSNSNDANITSCDTNVTITSPLVSDNCSENIALDFDGANDRVLIPYNSSLGFTTEFSVQAWIFPRANSYSRIFTKYSGGSTSYGQYVFDTHDGTTSPNGRGLRLVFTGYNGGTVISQNALSLNSWNHVAGTFDNGIIKLFVNGVEINSDTTTFTSIPPSSINFAIGEDSNINVPEYFDGQIDELSLWNKALNPSEITNGYNKLLEGTEPGLVAYYNFENGAGSTSLIDKTSNGNDGVLNYMDPNTDWVSSTAPVTMVSLTNDFNGTSDASGTYPEGETTVTWTATDANGNSTTITQSITTGDCAITYTFDNNSGWSPSNPDGVSTSIDDIIITSGNATFNSSTTANIVTIEAGASLTIETDFTASETILNSTSTSYASLISTAFNEDFFGTITYNRYVNSNANGNDLVSFPVGGQFWSNFLTDNSSILLNDGNANPTTYAFAPFDKISGDFINYTDASSATLTGGIGYRAATISGAPLKFTGFFPTSNSGIQDVIEINIVNSGPDYAKWNLIGNPYPSYLNLYDFFNYEIDNGVTNFDLFEENTAGIYAYNGTSYDIINLANIASTPKMAPGQGFFVSADATKVAAHDLQFFKPMQTYGTADDFISGRDSELLFMRLNLSSNSNSDDTAFYFNSNASEGLDKGYDAALLGGVAPDFSIYSHLLQENMGLPFGLQSLHPTNLDETSIPLGVNANQGEQISFSLTESTLPNHINIYLEDTAANTTHLLNSGNYTITPNTNLSGTGRFFLRTTTSTLSTIDNNLDTITIFYSNNSKEIVVGGLLKEHSTLELFDIQGRKIFSSPLDASNIENRVTIATLNKGVYVVNIQNDSQQKSKKIVVH